MTSFLFAFYGGLLISLTSYSQQTQLADCSPLTIPISIVDKRSLFENIGALSEEAQRRPRTRVKRRELKESEDSNFVFKDFPITVHDFDVPEFIPFLERMAATLRLHVDQINAKIKEAPRTVEFRSAFVRDTVSEIDSCLETGKLTHVTFWELTFKYGLSMTFENPTMGMMQVYTQTVNDFYWISHKHPNTLVAPFIESDTQALTKADFFLLDPYEAIVIGIPDKPREADGNVRSVINFMQHDLVAHGIPIIMHRAEIIGQGWFPDLKTRKVVAQRVYEWAVKEKEVDTVFDLTHENVAVSISSPWDMIFQLTAKITGLHMSNSQQYKSIEGVSSRRVLGKQYPDDFKLILNFRRLIHRNNDEIAFWMKHFTFWENLINELGLPKPPFRTGEPSEPLVP